MDEAAAAAAADAGGGGGGGGGVEESLFRVVVFLSHGTGTDRRRSRRGRRR